MTAHDAFAIIAAVVVAVVLMCLPAGAQDDPCFVCQAEHGVADCPCLPAQDEPAPIPPITAIACSPSTHTIAGCDRVWLP